MQAGQWESAHQLSLRFMEPETVADLFVAQAELLEQKQKFKEAERLYIAIEQPDQVRSRGCPQLIG
jgi:intraflagellar transport protein 172